MHRPRGRMVNKAEGREKGKSRRRRHELRKFEREFTLRCADLEGKKCEFEYTVPALALWRKFTHSSGADSFPTLWREEKAEGAEKDDYVWVNSGALWQIDYSLCLPRLHSNEPTKSYPVGQ